MSGTSTISGEIEPDAQEDFFVDPGQYSVTLDDVAPNCTVTSQNPQTINVASGATETAQFDVTCGVATTMTTANVTTTTAPPTTTTLPPPAMIQVNTATTG